MKRTASLALAALVFMSLSGCRAQELQLYSIVTGIAVDYEDEKMKITLESGGGMKDDGIQTKPSVSEGEGVSFSDCLSDFFRRTGKFPYLRHTGALLISENTEGKRLEKLLDFIVNEHNIRLNTRILAADTRTAGELFSEEDYFSTKALRASAASSDSLTAADIMLSEFIYLLYAEGADGYLPLTGEDKTGGLALFSGYRRAGELPYDLVPAFLMVMNMAESGNISVEAQGEIYGFRLTDCKSRMSASYENGSEQVDISVRAKFRAEDMLSEDASFYEKRLSDKIREDILKMCGILKKCGSDVLGTGRYIYRHDPEKWKAIKDESRRIFSESLVNVTVTASVDSTGRTREENK